LRRNASAQAKSQLHNRQWYNSAPKLERTLSSLISVTEARQRLLESFTAVESESIPLTQAAGRVLAEDVVAGFDLPLFANSSMDGFAVRAADVIASLPDRPVVLSVVADVPAGQMSPVEIKPGEAARIMTGAPLLAGADAVVPVEDTDHHERGDHPGSTAPSRVQIFKAVEVGAYVRPRGQDVRTGEVVLRSNFRLRPQDVGLLAMLGCVEVTVYRRPRVVMLSTGDELLPVEKPLSPGKIHDSNAYTLSASVTQDGGEAIYLGIAKDQEDAVRNIVEKAVENKADLILSSAGVSVGAFDFVRQVVEKHGRIEFWRVNMRPGKPLAFGSYRGIPFLGLPGNPVSAFVGYEVFVRPAIRKLSGLPDRNRPTVTVRLLEPVDSDGRESYLRAIVSFQNGSYIARLTGHQGSGNLLSLVQANALLIIPSGVKSLPAEAEVNAWLLGEIEEGNSV
jgi:molybdopterin molybdotransferase